MKRLFAALSLALLIFPVTSHASSPVQKWRTDPWTWNVNVSCSATAGCRVDSAVSCRIFTQLTWDTTSAFPLGLCELPENHKANGTAVDTMTFFALNVYARTSLTNTAGTVVTATGNDSVLVVAQVSMDGVNWVTATPTRSFDATRAAGQQGATVVDNNSLNGATIKFKQSFAQTGEVVTVTEGATAPNWNTLFGWTYVRWLIQGCGGQGAYEVSVSHWASPGTSSS